ncbi:MAG: hypothetical protein M3541_23730 [Acidobacteriota bacterium]|nr:hypothetical protein [Acidobacteriota bacterium]
MTRYVLNVGMDFEPEYIAIEQGGARAFVTLQDANAVAVLDLSLNAFTEIIALGASRPTIHARKRLDDRDTLCGWHPVDVRNTD